MFICQGSFLWGFIVLRIYLQGLGFFWHILRYCVIPEWKKIPAVKYFLKKVKVFNVWYLWLLQILQQILFVVSLIGLFKK